LALEAKDARGGNAYFRAQQNIGPQNISGQQAGITADGGVAGASSSGGYSASPVGKVDNFEKQKPIDQMKKYLFDPSKVKGDGLRDTYELEAENKKRMRNAFSLLFNSKNFFSEFKNIYKNYLTRDSISLADEKEWNRLKDEVNARASKTTQFRSELDGVNKLLADAENAGMKISEIQAYIKSLKAKKSGTKNKERRDSLQDEIDSAEIDISNLKNSAKMSSIDGYRKQSKKAKDALVSETEREMIARDALTEIENKISSVTANNKKSSDNVIMLVKKLIKNKAEGLLDRYMIENNISDEEIDSKNVDFANVPQDLVSKLKLLKELTTDDNPIFAFIDYHDEEFGKRLEEFDDKLLNTNINIGSMRMFDKLPAKILGKYFSSVAGTGMERKVIPLENLDADTGYLAIDSFIKKLEQINTKEQWEAAKPELKKLVKDLPLKKPSKDVVLSRLKGFWSVSRSGANSAKQLLTTLQQMRNEEMVNESFDELANKYASSFNVDINDFMIDLQEVAVFLEKSKKCTKVTQKASSDRKGKKYTKCVKDPDGSGYKRIHFGQKGVKATGDSGNTDRKKAFRARHGCDKAKPGTPKAESCKNW
jgi:hypothetical protein